MSYNILIFIVFAAEPVLFNALVPPVMTSIGLSPMIPFGTIDVFGIILLSVIWWVGEEP